MGAVAEAVPREALHRAWAGAEDDRGLPGHAGCGCASDSEEKGPEQLTAKDILEYVNYLRDERHNGAAAVNRQVTILRSFFRAIVAMGHLEPDKNPMAHFPKLKAAPVKLPTFLSEDEVRRLLAKPRTTTVLGLRDRALLTLLYGTGIRATEAATMRECDVDLVDNTVRVIGKGGHQRAVPLNVEVARALQQYRAARGKALPSAPFFRSRRGGPRVALRHLRAGRACMRRRRASSDRSRRTACGTPSRRTW